MKTRVTYAQARVLGKVMFLVIQSMCEQVSFSWVLLDGCWGWVRFEGSSESNGKFSVRVLTPAVDAIMGLFVNVDGLRSLI